MKGVWGCSVEGGRASLHPCCLVMIIMETEGVGTSVAGGIK